MKNVYGQFCPVAVACETFAERWTPLILRELVLGSRRFNEIHRGVPRMSRTLLAQRLRELTAAGVVRSASGNYQLTPSGLELGEVVVRLGEWGQRWASPVRRDRLDPRVLMWDMRRRIAGDLLHEPPGRRSGWRSEGRLRSAAWRSIFPRSTPASPEEQNW